MSKRTPPQQKIFNIKHPYGACYEVRDNHGVVHGRFDYTDEGRTQAQNLRDELSRENDKAWKEYYVS